MENLVALPESLNPERICFKQSFNVSLALGFHKPQRPDRCPIEFWPERTGGKNRCLVLLKPLQVRRQKFVSYR